MNGTKEFKTKRLLLRKHIPEDADILYEKFGKNPEMFRYSGWNPYATREMTETTIFSFIRSYSNPHFYGWAVEKDGQFIGTIAAYDYDEEKSIIEVGMSIAANFWRQGYATEVLRAVLRYLTEKEGIHTVTAWCADVNIGSAKAMEKAGWSWLLKKRTA